MPVLRRVGTTVQRSFSPAEAQTALASGEWELREGQAATADVVDPTGSEVAMPLEQVVRESPYRIAPADAGGGLRRSMEEARRQEFDTGGQGLIALGEGAASSLTLGGSDVVLDFLGADTAERAEYTPGFRTIGEVGGALGSMLIAGGSGLASKLPGSLAVQGAERVGLAAGGWHAPLATSQIGIRGMVARETAEGLAFGVGQAVSNLALSDHELSGEAIAGELISNGLYGAGFGAAAGLLGGSLSKLSDHMSLKRAQLEGATEAVGNMNREAQEKYLRELSEIQSEKARLIPGLDADQSKAVTQEFADGFNAAEKAARTAVESQELAFSAEDMIYSLRMSRQLEAESFGLVHGLDDGKRFAGAKDVAFGTLLGPSGKPLPDATPYVKKIANANAELTKIWGKENRFLDRAAALDASNGDMGGVHFLKKYPEKIAASAKPLNDLREAVSEMHRVGHEAAGLPWKGRTTAAKYIAETPEQTLERLAHAEEVLAKLDDVLPDSLPKKGTAAAGSGGRIGESRVGAEKAAPEGPTRKLLAKPNKILQKALDAQDPEVIKKHVNELEDLLTEITAGTPTIKFSPKKSIGKFEFDAEGTDALLAKDPHQRIAAAAQGGRKLSARRVPEARLKEIIEEVNTASAPLNKLLGKKANAPLDATDLHRFMLLSPDKAVTWARQFQDYVDTLGRVTKELDDGAVSVAFKEGLDQIEAAIARMRTPNWPTETTAELMQKAGIGAAADALQIKGPADDLLKGWFARYVVQKADLPKAPKELRLTGIDKQTGHPITDFAADAANASARRMGGDLGRQAIPQGGYLRSIVAGTAAVGFGRAAGWLTDVALGSSKVAQATGGHVSRVARAIERLAKGGSKGTRSIAPTALSLMNSSFFGDEQKKGKNLREAFKYRFDELAQIAADPMRAQQRIHNNLEPIRQLHPMLADHLEMQAVKDAPFLFEKAPKDPGGHNVMGLSRWKPSEDDLVRFAAYLRGMLDPAGVWERVVNGRVTPQEAEFLRVRRPATYAEIQRQVAQNLPEIQKNVTGDQRVRLSILFDVPVDPLTSKQTQQFIQQRFAEQVAEDQQPVDLNAGAFAENQPTETQALQNRIA